MLLKDLGDETLVITEANKAKLFQSLYKKYPKLMANPDLAKVFESAEEDDLFIWTEMQDWPLTKVTKHMIALVLDHYKDHPEANSLQLALGIKA